MQNSDYIKIASKLTPPSTEQTRRFAEYVSGAHSWYKHLPLYPSSRFIFFLDPNAGRQMMRTPLGRVEFVDVTDTSDRFHYSTRTTKLYREQFGYWNYFAPYGTSFLVGSKQGVLDTRSSTGTVILDSDKGPVSVPVQLLNAGSTNVTSLVHPHRNLHVYWAISPEKPNTRIEYPQISEEEFNTVPADLMNAMKFYCELDVRRSKISPSRWREIEPLDEEAEQIMNTRINPILDQIRESQLKGMEHAMEEFVKRLNAERSGW